MAAVGSDDALIEACYLTKVYRGGTRAVDRVNFSVAAGEVFGFLGPNGAGKSTTVMMLTTLIKPTSGTARVCGFDVVRQPRQVREQLGYVSQDVAVDEYLTGRENLLVQGKLYHVPGPALARRVDELLEMVDLAEHADKLVATYSGGMRKRLDIAAGLLHTPRLLFLDEPTLGLDVQTRARIWDYVRELRTRHGITVFLTTHYMEEADMLCDRIAIIDRGRIVALDTPSKLKASLAGDVLTLRVDSQRGPTTGDGDQKALLADAERELPFVRSVLAPENGLIQMTVAEGDKAVPRVVEWLAQKGLRADSLELKRPTLDDVFLRYTGRALRQGESREAYWRAAMAIRRARR